MASGSALFATALVMALVLAGSTTSHAARRLADTAPAAAPAAVPGIPGMPKPPVPTVPVVALPPMPAVPTVPAASVPPVPQVPAVPAATLPPMPAVPAATLPPMPAVPAIPTLPRPSGEDDRVPWLQPVHNLSRTCRIHRPKATQGGRYRPPQVVATPPPPPLLSVDRRCTAASRRSLLLETSIRSRSGAAMAGERRCCVTLDSEIQTSTFRIPCPEPDDDAAPVVHRNLSLIDASSP
ncbi:protein app1-like [Panicum miliaceum]|uniref:Protein app1-like n=1 Tax=Panicum miliaceum TaxID=4540 RepID=A0A3L6T4A0_PANMI|nr:protein app1-like [Panicum miliaceum]